MAVPISTPGGPQELARAIRRARETLGLSQPALAALAGVERSRLTKIEGGQFRTWNPTVQKLCNFLGVCTRPRPSASVMLLGERLATLSGTCPDLLIAIDAMVAAIEARYESSTR